MSVTYQLENDVALITLNRPASFNAITAELASGLVESMARAGKEARAAILTGAGKAFCAGADLGEIAESYRTDGPNLGSILDNHFHPAVLSLINATIPTVAAINGVAAGAGMGLALACDLRLMGDQAFFISAFAGIGLAPDSGTTWWLAHDVGVSRALEITLTNRKVKADEASSLGLAMSVVPTDALLSAAIEQASRLADLVPDSLVTTRKLIRDAAGARFEQALQAERAAQHRLGLTPEHNEGVSAFLEKRKADYRQFPVGRS